MSFPVTPEIELIQVFIKNASLKIQELSGITHVIIREGPRPELMEAVYRVSLTIKTFAATCNLSQVVDFITSVVDIQFHNIRLSNKKLTEEQKNEIKNSINSLKNMVNDLNKNLQDKDACSKNEIILSKDLITNSKNCQPVHAGNTMKNDISENTSKLSEDNHALFLSAIGQLSIWSFHSILDALTRIEGFSEVINNIVDKIDEKQDGIKYDIKLNLTRLQKNALFITENINQIRALRGTLNFTPKDFLLKILLKQIQESTGQPKKIVHWSTMSNIPNVTINCDYVIFAQLWKNLWKLLQEWEIAGKHLLPNILAKFNPNQPNTNSKYTNRLSLYLCLEEIKSIKFSPENLTFSKQTAFPDLAHIFHFSTQIAEKMGVFVSCAKTPSGNALFQIELPCSDIEQGDLVLQSESSRSEAIYKNAQAEDLNESVVRQSILVVDDEKDLRTILSMKISKMGYIVYAASNIKEALKIIQEKQIHLVISDLFLEHESGLELMKTLSESRPELPFVFISGADEDDISSALFQILSKYAKAFLSKPISTTLLKETIVKNINKIA